MDALQLVPAVFPQSFIFSFPVRSFDVRGVERNYVVEERRLSGSAGSRTRDRAGSALLRNAFGIVCYISEIHVLDNLLTSWVSGGRQHHIYRHRTSIQLDCCKVRSSQAFSRHSYRPDGTTLQMKPLKCQLWQNRSRKELLNNGRRRSETS